MPNRERGLLLSSSPHLFAGVTTQRIMLAVIIAILPSAVYGVVLYGLPALGLELVSVACAVGAEALFRLAIKRKVTVSDGSAVITGLLLALSLPPSTPWWMAGFGAAMATVVAKEFFGGLGANPLNPALVGRGILLMSFPAAITTWHKPFQAMVDAATTATPLNIVKQGGALSDVAASLGQGDQWQAMWQMFLGNRAGCVGESSIALILLGGLFLLFTGVIRPFIPLTMIGATALFSWAFGQDPLFAVLSGGVVFGAFFMATDYSSCPVTTKGQLVYGTAIGLIIAMIRAFGGYPEGVTYAILIMNIVAPFLDKLRMRKYGYVAPKAKEAAK
jgi:electron transport complex protein RnfD